MWGKYRKKGVAEMRPYVPGEDLWGQGIVIQPGVVPEAGGMIARDPGNHSDQWYMSKQFFSDNYEPVIG